MANGDDLLTFLYNYPIQRMNDENQNVNANKAQQKAESTFEQVTNGTWALKSEVEGPANARVATNNYSAAVEQIQANFYTRSVFVSQRSWCATHGASQRPFLTTAGVVLCMVVIIYDPVNQIGAMAHIDEDQDSSTIVDVIPKVFPGNAALQVRFYGGRPGPSMEEGTRHNLMGQLGALYSYNAHLAAPRLTIASFDVIGRPHYSDIIFDTRDGRMYPVKGSGPPTDEIMGYPLDSLFRYWPNGTYIPEEDGSNMAVRINRIRDDDIAKRDAGGNPNAPLEHQPLIDYLATVRCQWDGSPSGWAAFYAESNKLICRLTVEYAFSDAKVDVGDVGNVHEQLVTRLVGENKPMRFEQSFKRWAKWCTMSGVQKDAAAKAAAGSNERKSKDFAEKSLTFAISRMLKDINGCFSGPTANKIATQFEALLTAWLAKADNFPVPWEGSH
jgi:hypothetical protein